MTAPYRLQRVEWMRAQQAAGTPLNVAELWDESCVRYPKPPEPDPLPWHADDVVYYTAADTARLRAILADWHRYWHHPEFADDLVIPALLVPLLAVVARPEAVTR